MGANPTEAFFRAWDLLGSGRAAREAAAARCVAADRGGGWEMLAGWRSAPHLDGMRAIRDPAAYEQVPILGDERENCVFEMLTGRMQLDEAQATMVARRREWRAAHARELARQDHVESTRLEREAEVWAELAREELARSAHTHPQGPRDPRSPLVWPPLPPPLPPPLLPPLPPPPQQASAPTSRGAASRAGGASRKARKRLAARDAAGS